jgi:parallel beta-helix repeat protein
MAEKRPMAFMSYAHADDKFNNGFVTEFCQCLSGEVRLYLGEEFPIFLDRKDIKWGDSWKVRIEGSIDGTTLLIPIITPGFFKSQYCRDELSRFLERERKLGRADLIRPVYFIDTPLLEDEMKRNQDELAQIIASRQYADWRKLRFEELDSGAVRRALAELAAQIRDALDCMPRASEDHAPKIEPSKAVIRETKPLGVSSEERIERRKPIPEPPTIVVDQWHRGDFTTISQAIKKADPGSRILIRSGIYDEGLILDKPLEIVGDGNLGDVIIRAEGKDAISFKATRGKVVNLVLQQIGGGTFYGVDIQQGLLELEGCDITSNSLPCVGIHGKASPKLRGNKIHDGKQSGILVLKNGQGLIEDNDIFGNDTAGIEIREAGNPTVRGNKIHDGKQDGIFVTDSGQGLIEDNDIFGNAFSGIAISESGNPTVRGNRIHKNILQAFYVYDKGAGIIENNDLRDNVYGAWSISDDSRDLVKRSGNQE